MNITEIIFYVFSAVLVVASVGVITARNPVHAVLFLVFAFFNSAVIWLLLEAEFLGIVLVLVYVGAVMVLFLFVVMMLDINVAQLRAGFVKHAWFGMAVALVVIAEIGTVVYVKSLGLGDGSGAGGTGLFADRSNTRALGDLLYTEYLYPLELAAVILLVAIIAAIVLTMHKRRAHKVQDITAQVSVRAKDRIRVVAMQAEKKES